MKFPDLFYIKQTRVLNNLHAFSVELLARLYSRNNPQNAYDSDWGDRQISNFSVSVEHYLDVLGKDRAGRILKRKIVPPGFAQRPELDRDTFRMETLQANVEREIGRLHLSRAALIAWIQTGLLAAILTATILSISL